MASRPRTDFSGLFGGGNSSPFLRPLDSSVEEDSLIGRRRRRSKAPAGGPRKTPRMPASADVLFQFDAEPDFLSWGMSSSSTATGSGGVLHEDSAEAMDFFAEAARSGVRFENLVDFDPMDVETTSGGPRHRRQRNFSLGEDSLFDDHSSSSYHSTSSTSAATCSSNNNGVNNKGMLLPIGGGCFYDQLLFSDNNSTEDLFLTGGGDFSTENATRELEGKLIAKIADKSENGFSLAKFQFPHGLLRAISAHVVQESALEPCGMKGCQLYIYFEGENECLFVNSLRCDPNTNPTFELTLTLRQEHSKRTTPMGWLPSIVKRNLSLLPSSIIVSTSYKLVKRRKYRLYDEEELSLQ